MELPSAELYIRWLQANILLPMQLSIPPWRYLSTNRSSEVFYTIRRVFKVRKVLRKLLVKALEEARVDHLPIARPLWMEDMELSGFPSIADEYMVGECLIVAPILYELTLSRTVAFPEGVWVPCVGDSNRSYTSVGNLSLTVITRSLIDDPPCFRRVDIADCSL